jgi:hypothetical protein
VKIQIKMQYNDVKVLKEVCNVVKIKHDKTKNKRTDVIVFKFRNDNVLQVEATNSYIYNSVEFGKNNLAYATIDYVEQKLENTFCFAVWEHDLLDKCRKILKHKKTTVDETCYLVVETHEPNVVRDIPDSIYKTMDKMYFSMQTQEFEQNLNVYRMGLQTQDRHYGMIRAIDNLIETFSKDLAQRLSKNITQDLFGIDVDYFTQATKFMNMNDEKDQTTFMRYVKSNFYLWKHSRFSDDNVQNKETIIMTRYIDNVYDSAELPKHKELKSNAV